NSWGVRESALPMTGMTLTRGDRRRMSSISTSRNLDLALSHCAEDVPMTGRSDEVEKGVDSVIPESGVSLNPGLFSEDIVVLSFQVTGDFGETGLIVDLNTKSRCINHRQRNARAFLLKIYDESIND